MESLVSTEWLAKEIGASDLRVVDATYHLPDTGRDAAAEYEEGHIPGAVFMDLAELVDPNAPVENTIPPPEKFASRMQSLGLGDGSRIVLYDDSDLKSSARAWFMLKMFGAHDVAILDGGLAKWQHERRRVVSGKENLRHRHFTVWSDEDKLRTKDQVRANVDSCAEQILDARGSPRFTGEQADPRPGIEAGHIPGSRNLPYADLLNADGTFKDRQGLREAFEQSGVDLEKPVTTTCGSGITACVLAFGMHLLGKDQDVALYDGSWAEWGADPETPKEKGAAA